MKSTFDRQELIDSKYQVLFLFNKKANCEIFRAKDENKNNRLITLYNSSKIHRHCFAVEELLEAELLRKLNHENIVSYIDSGVVFKNNSKYHYLVTEFVSGESLSEKMAREGAFSQYTAVSIVLKVIDAIRFMHNQEPAIIHNNINLQNIFLITLRKRCIRLLRPFIARGI